MKDCLFCKIINKEIVTDLIYEDELFVAFKDIKPSASLHLLIVPKKHIASLNDIKDNQLISGLVLLGKKFAKNYRLIFNVGKGWQEINHLHMHLLSNQKGGAFD